jgi:hypothetical protein
MRDMPGKLQIEDFRFSQKDGQGYAFPMKGPEGGKTLIRSLVRGQAPEVKTVPVLGCEGPVRFEQTGRRLAIDLPKLKPCEFDQCYRITFA